MVLPGSIRSIGPEGLTITFAFPVVSMTEGRKLLITLSP